MYRAFKNWLLRPVDTSFEEEATPFASAGYHDLLPPSPISHIPTPIDTTESSVEFETESLFAGEWYHELLQRPPVPYIPTPTDTTESEIEIEWEYDEASLLSEQSLSDDSNSSSLSETAEAEVEPQTLSTPTTFPLFPLLPLDLRLEIWQHTHPPPRNVILSFPQTRRTRARIPNWDKQWPFPRLPYSHFITLLINRESRAFFLSHYQLIFSDFPCDEKKKKEGRKAGWWFDARRDSLCFGDGVRGLRWFMATFPGEEVWGRVRWVDVDVDLNAFHNAPPADPLGGYFAREGRSKEVLERMEALRLVTLRVVVVRPDQWRNRRNGYWRPWENGGEMVREWLRGRKQEKEVKLLMQYIWTEGMGPGVRTTAIGAHVTSKRGHEEFIAKYPGVVSDEVRSRWAEVGISLQDGGNKIHPMYKTVKEIFCRNLTINLY
ncbi:hypothetical protein L207DRAFT_513241 [Hyaloscypha variabilis F]|uniref:2EXR domain-containing protein n=1 Tax=Hyaloscypha variabilis (strain UAMH 11265 / GT02V1 / F) TaxID=1149755 RepID=A0A2J6RJR7_HYAVF|nr:hypothetical protein L207DRAFT_513241 [Hyaloscypha variabilis F]